MSLSLHFDMIWNYSNDNNTVKKYITIFMSMDTNNSDDLWIDNIDKNVLVKIFMHF